MNGRPLRVGMIGTGWMGEAIAPDFALCEEVELAAVAGRDADRTAAFAAAHGIPKALDVARLLDLLHSYSNPNPQLDASLDRLTEHARPWILDSGPSWEPPLRSDSATDDALQVQPRPLDRRLTAEQREAIAFAYGAGASQKDLAVKYGISDRSVKRLVARARAAGAVLRTRSI